MGKKSKSSKSKTKKKKQKKLILGSAAVATPPPKAAASNGDLVMLGIRLSPEEREKIKVYAAQNQTSVASLIRQYIQSLPS